jgi:RNA polymerase sigma factor (sigma-70 family)
MTKNGNPSYQVISSKLFHSLANQFPSAGDEAIKDCIEDAFYDFFKTASEEVKNDGRQTYALLYTIAANNLKDYFTDPKRKRVSSLDKLHDDGIDFPSQEEWERKFEAVETVNKYLSLLKEEDRNLLLMRAEKIPFDEIAKITDKKKHALEVQHTRAMKKFEKIARKDMGMEPIQKKKTSTADSRQPTADSRKRRKMQRKNLEIWSILKDFKKIFFLCVSFLG